MPPRMRPLLLVLALGLALATVPVVPAAQAPTLAAEAAAPADCTGIPCDQINLVCWIVFRAYCLG